jgi:hypothetical protein
MLKTKLANSELKLRNDSVSKNKTDWDIDKIANEILHDLNGSVSLSFIQETLKELIPRYESAPIQKYVPVFIRREAVKRLQAMRTHFAAPEIHES